MFRRNQAGGALSWGREILRGAAFGVWLPAVAAGTAVSMLGRNVLGELLDRVARGISFGWRPQEAFLGGKPSRPRRRTPGPPGTGVGNISRENREFFRLYRKDPPRTLGSSEGVASLMTGPERG